MSPIDLALQELLTTTRASRVTLRQDLPGDYAFPGHPRGARAGRASLRDERTVDLRRQPVVRELSRTPGRSGRLPAAFDDPAFQRMLETYGGLAAQIVTPVFVGGRARRDRLASPTRHASPVDRGRGGGVHAMPQTRVAELL